jgi:hypothetical protein
MSNSAGPKITKDGLVLDFDAANPKSYKPSSDPYFSAVSLLLSMNGANGSTTFTDSSPNALIVTATGNAQISTAQSKYGGSAGYFDGTGDYISIPDSSAPVLGGSDWTIEAWIYISVAKSFNGIYAKRSFGGYGFGLQVDGANTLSISASINGSSWALAGASLGSGYTVGSWIHVAVVRFGNTITGYKNGVATGTQTLSGSIWPSTGYPAAVGSGLDTSQDFNGYIDDFRISQFARYLSNFTPPNTSLPAIASTVPYDPYYIKTSLLLHMDGANGSTTFTDSGPNALSVTANGNANTSTAQKKFGSASASFDGTSNTYIYSSSNSVFEFGTGDFTVECWVYINSFNGSFNSFIQNDAVGISYNDKWWFSHYEAASQLRFGRHYTSDGAYCSWNPTTGVWYHVAACRVSGVMYLFINGVSQSVTSNIGSVSWGQNGLAVGAVSTPYYLNGYVDDIRITKGIARYKSSFTPPTTALIEYAPEDDRYFNNVSLLLHADGANNSTTFIDNSSNTLTLTTGGDAKISTAQSKFGSASAFFDGNGDYLTATSGSLFQFSGDFTVEFWAYSTETSGSSLRGMFDTRSSQSSTSGIMLRENGAGYLVYGNGTTLITTGSVRTANTWVHLAIVRSGSTITLYVNGTSAGTATNSTNYSDGQCLISGFVDTKATPYGFLGYIDELRVTKGIARYNSNFTIPSSAYPNNTYTPVTATVIDLTKNKITGTFTNGVDYNAANGGSLIFDGVDDYVNIPASTNLTFGTGDFTMEVWCKTRAKTMLYPALLSVNLAWAANVWVLIDRHNATAPTKFTFHAYNIASPLLTSVTATSNGVWYNVVVTRIGTLFSMYVNGVLESTATSSASLDGGVSNSINLGRQSAGDSTNYDGNISHARIYKARGLTSTEVYNNFVANRGRFGV